MTVHTTVDSASRPLEEELDKAVQRRMESHISYYVDHPEEIDTRLRELGNEWSIERVLQAKAGGLTAAGLLLGTTVNRKWLALSAIGTAFLLQHAIQGWCPPYIPLRRLGLRTKHEIEQERYALMALRGDFDRLHAMRNKLSEIIRIIGISAR
jgi:hypothetical protein